MKHYCVETSEELYKIIEKVNAEGLPSEIRLKKDTVYEIDKALVIKCNGVSLKGENSVLKGSVRIKLNTSGNICKIAPREKITGLSEGPFGDFWHSYAIPKPYMDEYGQGTALYYEDEPLPISRYPQQGFMNIKKVLNSEGNFIPEDERIFKWRDYKNVMLVGYWYWEWANQRCFIDEINSSKKTVTLKKPYHCFGYKDGAHYFALNVAEELNVEGQWVKNTAENTILLYRKKNQNYADITAAKNIIEANGVKNLSICGITFKECERNAVKITDSENVTIENCRILNTGAWGIIADNCIKTSVVNVSVSGTGGGGIALCGGDRKNLISSENIVKDCHVEDVARWHRTYTAAIQICGTGAAVVHNRIENVPHFAIVYHGNNHIIEKNEISGVCYESNDAGAIYSGADWTCRGIVIRDNYFHDIRGFMDKGCYGIYFDDFVSSAEVYRNCFVNVYQGVLIGGGRDYIVRDNIFEKCVSAVLVDDRENVWNDEWRKKLFEKAEKAGYKTKIWTVSYTHLTLPTICSV